MTLSLIVFETLEVVAWLSNLRIEVFFSVSLFDGFATIEVPREGFDGEKRKVLGFPFFHPSLLWVDTCYCHIGLFVLDPLGQSCKTSRK